MLLHKFANPKVIPNLSFVEFRNPSIQRSKQRICITMKDRNNNRRQPQKGRNLSIEAIQTIQALKRARTPSSSALEQVFVSKFKRLLKLDMMAVLRELLRQNECLLALKVFDDIRKEHWYKPKVSLYAEIISVLGSNGMFAKVELLFTDMSEECNLDTDIQGFNTLLKSLMVFNIIGLAMKSFELMRSVGCDPDRQTFRILINGLESCGETGLSATVRQEAQKFYGECLDFLEEQEEDSIQPKSEFVYAGQRSYTVSDCILEFLPMDPWTDDHRLFISRRLGSPEGVVQVYKCWSLETPIGDDSFSLMVETASPSKIDPATIWDQKDYLRLLQFLEVNSAMVNFRGHVILRSMVKSRRVGRPDGPATYWRCLDLLPMHNFGLVRPVDTHGTPQFLIVGRDVKSTTPGTTIDAGDWKAKYDNLDADFKQLRYELDSLKVTLGGVNDALTNCQSENQKLVGEIDDLKSANKQTQATLKDMEVERDSLKVSLAFADKELSACQIENKTLVAEIKDCSEKFRTLIDSVVDERYSL